MSKYKYYITDFFVVEAETGLVLLEGDTSPVTKVGGIK